MQAVEDAMDNISRVTEAATDHARLKFRDFKSVRAFANDLERAARSESHLQELIWFAFYTGFQNGGEHWQTNFYQFARRLDDAAKADFDTVFRVHLTKTGADYLVEAGHGAKITHRDSREDRATANLTIMDLCALHVEAVSSQSAPQRFVVGPFERIDIPESPKAPAQAPSSIDALAEAWASIDGKLADYRLERDTPIPITDPACKGHYEGYQADATELASRLRSRGFEIIRSDQIVAHDARQKMVVELTAKVDALIRERGASLNTNCSICNKMIYDHGIVLREDEYAKVLAHPHCVWEQRVMTTDPAVRLAESKSLNAVRAELIAMGVSESVIEGFDKKFEQQIKLLEKGRIFDVDSGIGHCRE